MQFVLLLSFLARGGRYYFQIDLFNPMNRRVLALMAPLVAGSLFYKATGLAERYFASTLSEGSIAILGYAFKMAGALLLVIAQGVVVTFLPLMSRAAAEKDLAGLREAVSLGLRSLTAVTIPVIGLMLVLGHPLVQLLFQRGAFDAPATDATSLVLIAYMGWVWAGGLGGVLTNALYARQETFVVVKVAVVGMVLYLAMAYVFVNLIGFVGLALAFSLSTAANVLVFIGLLRRRLRGLNERTLVVTLLKSLAAGTLMTGLVALGNDFSASFVLKDLPYGFSLLVRVALLSLLGGGAYFLLAWVMDIGEIKALARNLRISCQSLGRIRGKLLIPVK